MRGYPIWHKRGVYDGDNGFGNGAILQYLGGYDALGFQGPNNDFALYEESSFSIAGGWGNSYQFLINDSEENGFQYSFPYIRAEGDPVKPKNTT